jgi:hypothetical protein
VPQPVAASVKLGVARVVCGERAAPQQRELRTSIRVNKERSEVYQTITYTIQHQQMNPSTLVCTRTMSVQRGGALTPLTTPTKRNTIGRMTVHHLMICAVRVQARCSTHPLCIKMHARLCLQHEQPANLQLLYNTLRNAFKRGGCCVWRMVHAPRPRPTPSRTQ